MKCKNCGEEIYVGYGDIYYHEEGYTRNCDVSRPVAEPESPLQKFYRVEYRDDFFLTSRGHLTEVEAFEYAAEVLKKPGVQSVRICPVSRLTGYWVD